MRHFLYLLILSALLYGCDNESTPIGANFFQDAALDVSVLDTVTVKLATVRYEELITNNKSRLLVGHHADASLGSVTASTYFELSSPGNTSLTASNSSYNYLVLVLKYDGYSFYDTSSTVTFGVHRVGQEMEEDDDGYLYNHSRYPLLLNKLGSATFTPRPHGDSIAIKIDDQLGLDLYNKLLAKADEITSQSLFLKYIQGLAVLPDSTTSGAVLGFTTKADLRLYNVDRSVVPSTRDNYVSFPLNSNGTFFNHIYADRTNTALEGELADEEDRIDASQTNAQAYLQAGTGLAFRVDFPHIKNLRGLDNFYITNAVLRIYPSHGSYNDLVPLPDVLTSSVVYPENTRYTDFASSIAVAYETELPRDAYYSVDVTSFIQSLIADMGDKDDQFGLLFKLQDAEYNASVSSLFAGTAKTYLTIYFATIKNN
jgi:hypothetical protein